MGDAVAAVASLAGEGQPVAVAVELRAPGDQLVDPLGGLADDVFDHLPVAQLAAGLQRVGHVVLEAVLRIEDRGDASLGMGAVGLPQASLVQHQDRELRVDGQGRAQPARPPPMISTSVKKWGTCLG